MNETAIPQSNPGQTAEVKASSSGPNFDFHRDTFAFANETKWRYEVDLETGWQIATPRVPEPDYTLHCFVMARSAKQFRIHARFCPSEPAPDDATGRRLIRAVVSRGTQRTSEPEAHVVIPGYAGLREFSAAREPLLKAECGGAWRSYFQRGNWRMVFPFTRGHQQAEARRLAGKIRLGQLAVVHVLRFPELTINHTLLLFAVCDTGETIGFWAYDPNVPEQEVVLTYDCATRTFALPRLPYFAGGRVDAYEIYRGWVY